MLTRLLSTDCRLDLEGCTEEILKEGEQQEISIAPSRVDDFVDNIEVAIEVGNGG